MYLSPALRISAPGSRPASVRIWKPLQMPSTSPPPSAKRFTDCMTGEKRASAQVIAIGKPTGDQHCIHSAEILRIVPEEGDRLLCHFGNHMVRIVVAVGTRKNQNTEFHAFRLTVSGHRSEERRVG